MISTTILFILLLGFRNAEQTGFLQTGMTRELGNTAKFVTKLNPYDDIVNSEAFASSPSISASGSLLTVGSLGTNSNS